MDGRDRDHDQEHVLYDMIHSRNEENEEEDDCSQYLNPSGEGIEEEQPRDEGEPDDDAEEIFLELSKSGEVYIWPLVIIGCVLIDLYIY